MKNWCFFYLSAPLAQHVYTEGTTLSQKQRNFFMAEDMQVANMVYSDPTIEVKAFGFAQRGNRVNHHRPSLKNATLYRQEYPYNKQ